MEEKETPENDEIQDINESAEEVDYEQNDEEPEKPDRHGHWALWTIVIAVVLVLGASFVPWTELTGGKIKSFNLFSDIVNDSTATDGLNSAEQIDPELLAAQKEAELNRHTIQDAQDTIVQPIKPARIGNLVVLEDYTSGNHGLSRLKAALESPRVARIAMVGDSYIEGDIICQDFRQKMQTAYGGNGVGYMNLHTEFAAFRQSIHQGGKGWTLYNTRNKPNWDFMFIAEEYFKPAGSALATYEGTEKIPHAAQWNTSKFLFIAPNNTTVSLQSGEAWTDYQVEGRPGVQCLEVKGTTKNFAVKTADPQLIGLGVWINDSTGVTVDCMSSRGIAGLTLSKVSQQLCQQMDPFVQYDLIILEFGINAMSATQKDYDTFKNRMVGVVSHLRQCYPKADFLIMGVGDRGEKIGGAVHSIRTIDTMVAAQRNVAREAHCLFWDTREAMGGQDAIVEWTTNGYANKDYIHMTHKGGERLGGLLFDAIQNSLK